MSENETAGKRTVETARAHVAAGRHDLACAEVRDALNRGVLGSPEILRVGRLLRKRIQYPEPLPTAPSIVVAGQCTTTWLVDALRTWTTDLSPMPVVVEAPYDNVLQQLATRPDLSGGVAVLLPWNERLLGGALEESASRVDAELAFWKQVWVTASGRGIRIIQVGLDCTDAGAAGALLPPAAGGDIARVRSINRALRSSLPKGALYIDLEWISGSIGRSRFYDARQYWWTRNPFSEAGSVELARHVRAAVMILDHGPRKVLAVDLDNTIWGGVVGETGPLDIDLGGSPAGLAFQDFQRFLQALAQRGCLLAAISKNNPADARAPFESNPEMVLRLSDFVAFEVGWESKSVALRRIAETLNLGLDAFAFFDDEPAERELMRVALPDVAVINVPPDPSDFRGALVDSLLFDSPWLTAEDRERTRLYRDQSDRLAAATSIVSQDEYLESLQLAGSIERIDGANIERITQLLAKTNQFNLTSRRHNRAAVEAMLGQPGSIGLAIRVSDRFGDYGLVSAIIATPAYDDPASLEIDTWIMSCRVISRSVEAFAFNAFLDAARTSGCQRIIGHYVATAKNALTAQLYPELGFSLAGTALPLSPAETQSSARYVLEVLRAKPIRSFVRNAPGARAAR